MAGSKIRKARLKYTIANIYLPLTMPLVSRSQEVLPSTLYIMRPMDLQRLEFATSNNLGDDAFTRTNALGGDVFTRKYMICAQYPLHHVTYAPAKFEIATSNGLGNAFTRKYIV